VPHPSAPAIEKAAHLIGEAKKPLIMCGHGVILSNAYAELQAFAEKTGIPVITTLLGLSAFPETHPLAMGCPVCTAPRTSTAPSGRLTLSLALGCASTIALRAR